jgi:hypothetical protein
MENDFVYLCYDYNDVPVWAVKPLAYGRGFQTFLSETIIKVGFGGPPAATILLYAQKRKM